MNDILLFSHNKKILLGSKDKNIATLIIPDYVEKIHRGAFYGYKNLKEVQLPNTIKIIGNSAFYNCSNLEHIILPDSIIRIGKNAFNGCKKLCTINIPQKLSSLKDGLFSECHRIKTININKNIRKIESPFWHCNSLSSIIVDEDNDYFASREGVLFDKKFTHIIKVPDNYPEKSYSIPNGIKTICDRAFAYCRNIEHIIFNPDLEVIEDYALYEMINLKEINIPKSIKKIGYGAFTECKSLDDITFNNDIEFSDELFIGCPEILVASTPKGLRTIRWNKLDDDYDDSWRIRRDYREETWDALTDGQYGDFPGGDIDYEIFGF